MESDEKLVGAQEEGVGPNCALRVFFFMHCGHFSWGKDDGGHVQ